MERSHTHRLRCLILTGSLAPAISFSSSSISVSRSSTLHSTQAQARAIIFGGLRCIAPRYQCRHRTGNQNKSDAGISRMHSLFFPQLSHRRHRGLGRGLFISAGDGAIDIGRTSKDEEHSSPYLGEDKSSANITLTINSSLDDAVEDEHEEVHDHVDTTLEMQLQLATETQKNQNSDPELEFDSEKKAMNHALSNIAPYKTLMLFICTTIIIWLSEPLLSLIDTTIVGKFASRLSTSKSTTQGISPNTIQLAALGPATMICDNFIYATYFLAMATTNQLAIASAQSDVDLQIQTTSHALGVGAILGLMIGIAIFGFGSKILLVILGEGGALVQGMDLTQPIIQYSLDYAKVRGLVAPLSIMGLVAQAISLATLDTRTPAIAVCVASLVNILGDILLVAQFGMGLRGAAIATAAASATSSLVLIRAVRKKVANWKSMSSSASNKQRRFISLPDFQSMVSLVTLAGPMFFVIFAKLVCYSAMTLRAGDFGMMSMATHSIMIKVFFFHATFGDAFSQAVQAFLPKAFFQKSAEELHAELDDDSDNSDAASIKASMDSISNRNKRLANALLKRILYLGAVTALFTSCSIKQIFQHGGSIFTSDDKILALLSDPRRVLYAFGSIIIHPLAMSTEGVLLATRDLNYLVGGWSLNMIGVLSLLKFSTHSFTGVWRALFSLQVVRFVIFGGRVFATTRTTNANTAKSKTA